MTGIVNINGVIGSPEDANSVWLVDVISQVQSQPQSTDFLVNINSVGGDVEEGFNIYDYLRSLGKPIVTVGNGCVASIATVIFMAGDQRRLTAGTDFMIHLPTGFVQGTADDISDYGTLVKSAEKRLVDFYTEKTGLTKEAVAPLLKSETFLSNEQAFDLNFTTEQIIQFRPVAYFKHSINKNQKQMNTLTKEDKTWIESLFSGVKAFMKGAIKAIDLTDANGVVISFPEVEEGTAIAIGDKATVDGAPADGSFLMEDKSTYVFVGGALTEIVVSDDGEMDALKEQVRVLTEQLTAEQTAKATLESEKETLTTSLVAIRKQITSKLAIADKGDGKNNEDVGEPKNRTLKKQTP